MKRNRYETQTDAVKFLQSRGVRITDKTIDATHVTPSLRILGSLDFLKSNGYTITK